MMNLELKFYFKSNVLSVEVVYCYSKFKQKGMNFKIHIQAFIRGWAEKFICTVDNFFTNEIQALQHW